MEFAKYGMHEKRLDTTHTSPQKSHPTSPEHKFTPPLVIDPLPILLGYLVVGHRYQKLSPGSHHHCGIG